MKVVSLPFNQILIITIIFIYSSSIFSGANPVEYFYNFFDHTKIFVAIDSSYPFLFRTPNPQFSVFLILVQIFLYLSKNQILKRISFIFIPIFLIFSYPFLKIGYFIFLLSILIIKSQKFKSFFSKSLLILITYLISSLSIWLAILYIKNYNLEFYNDLLISHRFLDNFHTPKFALFSLFSFFIYILSLIIFYRFKKI